MWYYFFFLLISYHTVGSTFFYLFRDNICSLTTRDPGEKTQVQFFRKLTWTLISGIIIGMLINMVALPMWLEKDINGYPILMISLSIVAIPLLEPPFLRDMRSFSRGCNCHHHFRPSIQSPTYKENWMEWTGYDFCAWCVQPLC